MYANNTKSSATNESRALGVLKFTSTVNCAQWEHAGETERFFLNHFHIHLIYMYIIIATVLSSEKKPVLDSTSQN